MDEVPIQCVYKAFLKKNYKVLLPLTVCLLFQNEETAEALELPGRELGLLRHADASQDVRFHLQLLQGRTRCGSSM